MAKPNISDKQLCHLLIDKLYDKDYAEKQAQKYAERSGRFEVWKGVHAKFSGFEERVAKFKGWLPAQIVKGNWQKARPQLDKFYETMVEQKVIEVRPMSFGGKMIFKYGEAPELTDAQKRAMEVDHLLKDGDALEAFLREESVPAVQAERELNEGLEETNAE